MIRSIVTLGVLGLAGLFAYFYFNDSTGRSNADKARDAVANVGDTVLDESIAGIVRVRLGSKFGLDAARFLHVHHDAGRVVVYGLLPGSIKAEDVAAEARGVPGVKSVEVLVQPLPAGLGGNDKGARAPG